MRDNIKGGLAYRFKVKAAYLNGYSPESPIASIYACTFPSLLSPPTLVEAKSTDLTVQWK